MDDQRGACDNFYLRNSRANLCWPGVEISLFASDGGSTNLLDQLLMRNVLVGMEGSERFVFNHLVTGQAVTGAKILPLFAVKQLLERSV